MVADWDLRDVCAYTQLQEQLSKRLEFNKPYKRILLQHLPREARALAWRVLHGSLYCGAFLVRIGRERALPRACCASPNCAGALETLTHLFVHCPDVQPAVSWLLNLWGAIHGTRPDLQGAALERVLLADDHRDWHPEANLQDLWTTLRVAYLHAVWSLRCERLHGRPGAVSASAIACKIIHAIRSSIKIDWLRVSADLKSATDVCSSWFRGPDMKMSEAEFVALWGHRQVLCAIVNGQMEIRFSTTHPIALP